MTLRLAHSHRWDLSPREAVVVQRELAGLVLQEPMPRPPHTVAGVDMSVRRGSVQASVVVLEVATLRPVAEALWRGPVTWPYVPGLLSFREIPALLHALEQLDVLPDLILADGQGVAHPRRFGIASHLGVLLDRPVIGVAKSRLVGTHDVVEDEAGSRTPLFDGAEVIGMVVRSRHGVKPLYVSVGHRVDLEQAVEWTLACVTRYRLPEPSRRAHLLSRAALSHTES